MCLRQTIRGTGILPKEGGLKRLIPALVIFAVVIAGAVSWLLMNRQKASANPPAASVAGTWEATVKYDWGDSYHEVFDFQVNGQELSGTAGFLGSPKGKGRPIWDGKIAGDQISFTTKTLTSLSGDDKNYEDKHYYKGVVKGDTIDVHPGDRQQRRAAYADSVHGNPGKAVEGCSLFARMSSSTFSVELLAKGEERRAASNAPAPVAALQSSSSAAWSLVLRSPTARHHE